MNDHVSVHVKTGSLDKLCQLPTNSAEGRLFSAARSVLACFGGQIKSPIEGRLGWVAWHLKQLSRACSY